MADMDGGERVALGYTISGRVQGVGFRWWTVKLARELGLAGRVWNEADGTVGARAAGPRAAMEAFGRALRVGPPAARVESVRTSRVEGPPESWPDDFAIER